MFEVWHVTVRIGIAAARQTGSGRDSSCERARWPLAMIWHVIYEDRDDRVQSRAARSRDLAIHMACQLLRQSSYVRRVIGPDGSVIERVELEAHYDEGRFPGFWRAAQSMH
jgi:hypothetical protein